jgi:glycosyltransferase involved in cell wall biosynthesis
VVCFSGKSGLTDYTVSLCNELSKLCNLQMLTSTVLDQNQYKTNFTIKQIFRRTRFYPIDIFRFAYYVIQEKPDVILFESWLKYPLVEWLLVKLFKMNQIKTALTIHDLLPHYPKPWSKFLLSHFYAAFDQLIVHSQKAAIGLKEMGVKTVPLVVPHGVYDIFNIDNLTRQDVIDQFPNVGRDDFVVLFFGYIDIRKGIFEYLAASELLIHSPNIKFLISGASSLKGEAVSRLEHYRNNKNVILHDKAIPMNEVQHYFSLANIVVLPYLEGTTSGILKMAIAFGKPIIVTDVGDFPETLEDWPGLLIPVENIAKNLANAIVEMQQNNHQYLQLVDTQKEKYQWNLIAKKHIDYFAD